MISKQEAWDVLRQNIRTSELDEVSNPFGAPGEIHFRIPSSAKYCVTNNTNPPPNSWWIKRDDVNRVVRLSLDNQAIRLEYLNVPLNENDDDIVINYSLNDLTVQEMDGEEFLVTSTGESVILLNKSVNRGVRNG